MRRTTIRLDDVAALPNLLWAFWRAARGRRHQQVVRAFGARLDENLDALRKEILGGEPRIGEFRRFQIHDPKLRVIHAPAFRERVLHHAVMRFVGPALDRSLVDDTFACRVGKGGLAAAQRAQQHGRRLEWAAKLDARSYFASIDHGVLKAQLRRRIRGRPVLDLLDRIVDSFCSAPGMGLPIGALTSQHFANLYLSPLDRHLLEYCGVPGLVRYMDDTVVWARNRGDLHDACESAVLFAKEHLVLALRAGPPQRTRRGLTLCGFKVFPHRLGLSQRRLRRYRDARRRWERAYEAGWVDARELQSGYSSALATTCGADARHWRAAELRCRKAVDA